MKKIDIKVTPDAGAYDVIVGSGRLESVDEIFLDRMQRLSSRCVVISNEQIFKLHGQWLVSMLENSGIEAETILVGDGERFKNLETLEAALDGFSRFGLKRTDFVVAFGGGVVGDLAGFAAAVYLRGVPFVQVPTTLLAMVDSSVGGKTGINSSFGKNLVGSFHHPSFVLADVDLLATLDAREFRAGVFEMVKHAGISGGEVFDETKRFVSSTDFTSPAQLFADDEFAIEISKLVAMHVAVKADVVGRDARENVSRSDAGSRKILNFGHTIAHALERATNYEYFLHGEAVGYGIAAANELAKNLEFCDKHSVNLLNDVVRSVGVLPPADGIDVDEVIRLIGHDKKNTERGLQWILLRRVGEPEIVSGEKVPVSEIRNAVSKVLEKSFWGS
ncbi:MAG: 3-dehydroquinate synthase [Pyrinomonadaceae bacterium]